MNQTRVTESIDEAVAVLASGGLVGIPTETVYGLAARVSDERAVRRVFTVKGRPTDHPLIVHVSSLEQAAAYGEFDARSTSLARRFWPGPLTVLVRRRDSVPDAVTGGRGTVAIRVPAHPMALELIDRLGEGVVAPSANRFGHVSPTDVSHVVADLDGLVDLVLDGGRCQVGVESTIVDCTGVLQVLRPGAVSAAQIEETTGERLSGPDGPSRAPGMLNSHYAPSARVHLVSSSGEARRVLSAVPSGAVARVLGDGVDAVEYASTLYGDLRRADDDGVTDVVAVLPAGEGLAAAVRDRLTKAAAERP
ncbi:MAG: L-threonylcarbamoyladenylate synthase [Actinomycetota bacterium]